MWCNSVLSEHVKPLSLETETEIFIRCDIKYKELFLPCFVIFLEIQRNTGGEVLHNCLCIYTDLFHGLLSFNKVFIYVKCHSQLRVKKGLTVSELFFSSPTPCGHCKKFCLSLHALVWGQIAIAGLSHRTMTSSKWGVTWFRRWTPPAVNGSYTCLSRAVTGIVI